MPTLGWIQETAIDRYWERGGDGHTEVAPPPVLPCFFCDAVFETKLALASHISFEHPLERPVLFLEGRAVETAFVIRTTVRDKDIDTANCQVAKLSVDGQPDRNMTPEALAKALADRRDGFCRIVLDNRRSTDGTHATAEYVVKIAIPQQSSLSSVDEAFIKYISIDKLDLGAIRRFTDACCGNSDALEYLDALAAYATGVLVKDQNPATGTELPFEAFREKFQAALAVLAEYRRPLAQTIAACIRFNLNDFSHFYSPTGIQQLDEAMAVFRHLSGTNALALSSGKPLRGRLLPACPIDHATNNVLGLFAVCRSTAKFTTEFSAEINAFISAGTTSELDRVKLQALYADAAMRRGNTAEARTSLRALTNDHSFGIWATHQLRVIGDL